MLLVVFGSSWVFADDLSHMRPQNVGHGVSKGVSECKVYPQASVVCVGQELIILHVSSAKHLYAWGGLNAVY